MLKVSSSFNSPVGTPVGSPVKSQNNNRSVSPNLSPIHRRTSIGLTNKINEIINRDRDKNISFNSDNQNNSVSNIPRQARSIFNNQSNDNLNNNNINNNNDLSCASDFNEQFSAIQIHSPTPAMAIIRRNIVQENSNSISFSLVPPPNFNGFNISSSNKDNKLICPSAPKAKRRKNIDELDNPVAKKAAEVSMKSNQVYRNVPFTVQPIHNANGQYSQAFTIASAGGQVVDKVENDQIIFKSFLPDLIAHNSKRLSTYITNSVDQYEQLIYDGFPVSIIYNVDTVKEDGFYLVENIPYKFPILWDEDALLSEIMEKKHVLSEGVQVEVKDLLIQVKRMFKFAYDEKMPLDISSSNVRINKDRIVVLIDFREELDGYDNSTNNNPFEIDVSGLLRSFANSNKEIYDYLDPRQQN
jgi:hypothetical protein